MNFTENGITRSNLKTRALHKLFCDKSLGLWKLSDVGIHTAIAYTVGDCIKKKRERMALGEEKWKARGSDKKPRCKEGYFRRYQNQRGES